ncbi:MAG: hypothetical protein U0183_08580 [Polyangiaceae bacterium]
MRDAQSMLLSVTRSGPPREVASANDALEQPVVARALWAVAAETR